MRLVQRLGRTGHRPGHARCGMVLASGPAELLQAFRLAVAGGNYLHPRLGALMATGEDGVSDGVVLSDREREVVLNVWKRYGGLTGGYLSQLTHQRGTPWFVPFTTKGQSAQIPDELIKEHYDAPAEAAAQA